MKGLWVTVTNVANGKTYFVSTVRSSPNKGSYETAVFRKIFGPFANFWRPKAIFFGDEAAALHAFATELVRHFDPDYWRIFDRGRAPLPYKRQGVGMVRPHAGQQPAEPELIGFGEADQP